jgi:Zn-finger protein
MLSGLCEVAHMHRHSMADTKHLRKHFIWVGTRSPSDSSECPFCPFCPISMRWAFHTNLNLTSIMLSELCEVAHLHRHLRRHFIWVGTRSPSDSSACPFCPFCPFWPISMRRAFHTNFIQSSVIRNGICEVAHIHRHSRAYTRHLRKRFIWVGTKSPSESSVSVRFVRFVRFIRFRFDRFQCGGHSTRTLINKAV